MFVAFLCQRDEDRNQESKSLLNHLPHCETQFSKLSVDPLPKAQAAICPITEGGQEMTGHITGS